MREPGPKNTGFTIIEVLIAVAILGIVGFSISHFLGSARKLNVKISDSSSCDVAAQS
ncbi:MAG: prepilin-type N-terminal cleavage/methylation domain-containing protein, partial [Bdellovibrionales bacterium]|nr:prepilin-type N-terminal cleavage/methylation domain-containing protein [Bdellovibrionales bacterium]